MLWMGSTSQVTSCDLFIRETGKGGGIGWECLRLTGNPVEPFVGHLGQIRERLENVRQPLLPDPVYGG